MTSVCIFVINSLLFLKFMRNVTYGNTASAKPGWFPNEKTFEIYHKIVKLELKFMLNVRLIHHE